MRARDLVFEALATACRLPLLGLTKTERGRMQAATKELKDVGATPEDIEVRAKAYRIMYPNTVLTPQALTGNWNLLKPLGTTAVSAEDRAKADARVAKAIAQMRADSARKLGLEDK